VESPAGIQYKLGQILELGPGRKLITNIYLSPTEFNAFTVLPGLDLTKVRWHLHAGRHLWALDEYPSGLQIAEVEYGEGEVVDIPHWCGVEITNDESLTGWALAKAANV
jgi:CYTH domain-containing protein